MKVKRSKDPITGTKYNKISIQEYCGKIRVNVPNRYYSDPSIDLTFKEARRLASALLQFTKSMEA